MLTAHPAAQKCDFVLSNWVSPCRTEGSRAPALSFACPAQPWRALTLFLVVLLSLTGTSGPAAALAGSTRLGNWLALERLVCPGASVCSGFYAWRTVSRYRRQAGIHDGYDIALPPGSRVVAGWTGQVVAIVGWSAGQSGVSVMSADGFLTTYGHLVPGVRVGDVLNAGDVVGTTVIDHVDIKMKAPDGRYFDFGSPCDGDIDCQSMPWNSPQDEARIDRAKQMARHTRQRLSARLASLRRLEDRERRLAQAGAISLEGPTKLHAQCLGEKRLLDGLRRAEQRVRLDEGVADLEQRCRQIDAFLCNIRETARTPWTTAEELYREGAISRSERDAAQGRPSVP